MVARPKPKAADEPQADGVNTDDELTPEAEVMQQAEDKAAEQGFRGVDADPTPNENYTVAGVSAGKPTPETDEKQAAKVGSLKFR